MIALSKLDNLTQYEQVIINDIILLLDKKGFKRFVNFDTDVIVDKCNYWSFTGRVNIIFDFKTDSTVRKGEYYEFG